MLLPQPKKTAAPERATDAAAVVAEDAVIASDLLFPDFFCKIFFSNHRKTTVSRPNAFLYHQSPLNKNRQDRDT